MKNTDLGIDLREETNDTLLISKLFADKILVVIEVSLNNEISATERNRSLEHDLNIIKKKIVKKF